MMKILSISNMHMWPWGKEKGIPSIAFSQKELARRGYEVHFMSPVMDGTEKYSEDSGIHIYRFNFPFNHKKHDNNRQDNLLCRIRASATHNLYWLFFQIFAFFCGLRIGLRVKPDIIYAHSLTSVFPAYMISKLLKTKFITRIYGTRQLYWRRPHLWYRIKEFRDYMAMKVPSDYIVLTNDGTCGDRLAGILGVSMKRIKCWRNGIDETIYDPVPNAKSQLCTQMDVNPALKIIASTSGFQPFYGADKLLCSLKKVFENNPDTICIIAGNGPEKGKMEKFVRTNDMSDKVFFLGIVDREMIKKILYASDIFVLPAQYHNCTNTMWEAMATGRCIVTSENEAIKEVLTSGENAILVPTDNLKQLPEIISRLLNNDRLREKLGRNARIRAQEVLEPWQKRIEKEIVLLEDLMNSRPYNPDGKRKVEEVSYEV